MTAVTKERHRLRNTNKRRDDYFKLKALRKRKIFQM